PKVKKGRARSSRQRSDADDRRLEVLIEATTDFVGIADRHGRALYINRAGRELLGLSGTEDISNRNVADQHPQWARAIVQREGVPTARRDGVWRGETALLTHDGREIPTSQVIVAHRGSDGEVDFFATVARDITEHKRAEQQATALLEIAKDISGSLDLSEILD